MICDNCHHKGVCVFENNIQQKIDAINTNAEEPLQVTVTCKHFYERSTTRLDRTMDYGSTSTNELMNEIHKLDSYSCWR